METLWRTLKRCTSQVCVAIGMDTEPETEMNGGPHIRNTLWRTVITREYKQSMKSKVSLLGIFAHKLHENSKLPHSYFWNLEFCFSSHLCQLWLIRD